MKKVFLKLCLLICVYSKLYSSDFQSNSFQILDPSQYFIETTQCEKVVNFLKNVIKLNKVFRDRTVNIAVADYSRQLDTNCILRKLQEQDDRIVIDIFTRIKFRFWILEPDYLILIEDYTDNVSHFISNV